MEDILAALTAAIEAERKAIWLQADLCAEAASHAWGKLAEVAGCSKTRIRSLAKAAMTFSEERRFPDVPMSIFVLAATSRKALDLFDRAVEEQWSIREYRQAVLGKPVDREKCPTCGRVR